MDESSCARDVAMVTACCFVRPCAEPPHAQTSADAATNNVVRKPARRNCRFTPSLCPWTLECSQDRKLEAKALPARRASVTAIRALPNNGKLPILSERARAQP